MPRDEASRTAALSVTSHHGRRSCSRRRRACLRVPDRGQVRLTSVSVISRVAWHLTLDRHKPIDSPRCDERIVPGAEQWCAADPGAFQNNESAKVPDRRRTASRCTIFGETRDSMLQASLGRPLRPPHGRRTGESEKPSRNDLNQGYAFTVLKMQLTCRFTSASLTRRTIYRFMDITAAE
jgi:hypothetical protein